MQISRFIFLYRHRMINYKFKKYCKYGLKLQKVREQGIRFWNEKTFWHEIILIPTFGLVSHGQTAFFHFSLWWRKKGLVWFTDATRLNTLHCGGD